MTWSVGELSSPVEQLRDLAGQDVPMVSVHGGEPTAKELAGYRDLGLEHVLLILATEPRDETLRQLDGLQAELAKLA
jgi:hypothetical protein